MNMWFGTGEEVILENFDLASIPAIEIPCSKVAEPNTAAPTAGETIFGHTLVDSGVYEPPRHESLDGLLDFQDMMASNGSEYVFN